MQRTQRRHRSRAWRGPVIVSVGSEDLMLEPEATDGQEGSARAHDPLGRHGETTANETHADVGNIEEELVVLASHLVVS
jgi:hypothetical protein